MPLDLMKLADIVGTKIVDAVRPLSNRLKAIEDRPLPAAGPAGRDGVDGKDGAPGPAGEKGDPGMAGAPGAPGAPGEKGIGGEPGPRGPVGEPGPQGLPGADGPAGPPGPPGPEGPLGPQGGRGEAGIAGPKGEPGEKGDAGEKGADGVAGAAGEPGPQGEKGAQGEPGPQGEPGIAPPELAAMAERMASVEAKAQPKPCMYCNRASCPCTEEMPEGQSCDGDCESCGPDCPCIAEGKALAAQLAELERRPTTDAVEQAVQRELAGVAERTQRAIAESAAAVSAAADLALAAALKRLDDVELKTALVQRVEATVTQLVAQLRTLDAAPVADAALSDLEMAACIAEELGAFLSPPA